MAKRPEFDARDLALLERGQWQSPETDRRSLRLAKLGLCRSTARDPAAKVVAWAISDKGRLLLQLRQLR